MNPIESVATVLRNLLNFNGRASRSEFWWFYIIALVVCLALAGRFFWFSSWYFLVSQTLYYLLSLAFFLPVFHLVIMPAATVRRLHDSGRSALWLLIVCVGIITGWGIIIGVVALAASTSNDGWEALIIGLLMGGVWALASMIGLTALTIVLILPGTSGPNRYGPDPLRPELAADMTPGPPRSAPSTSAATDPPGHDDHLASPGSARSPENPEPLYCTQCGTQLPTDARFCVTCGSPLR